MLSTDNPFESQIIASNIAGVTGYDIELIQYTGLFDKNGMEIYEGDIIRSYNEFGDCFAELSVVEWDVDIACFKGVAIHLLSLEEVIGNIYEHPNLLEDGETA